MTRNENEIARLNKLIQMLEQELYAEQNRGIQHRNWDLIEELEEKLADAEYRYSVEYSR